MEKIDVEVRTLDSYCSEKGIQNIAFLKIDVEGFEEDVLLGANSLLKSQNIGLILFEIREKILTSVGRKGSAVFAPLLDNGYKIVSLEGHALSDEELSNPIDGDYLAAIDVERVLENLGESKLSFI